MKYKLVASDIDGTLINSKKELTRGTVFAAEAARNSGIVFTFSTGRPIQGLTKFIHLVSPGAPVVTYNGAVVLFPEDGRVLYELSMAPSAAEEVIRRGTDAGATVMAWSHGMLYASVFNEQSEKYRLISGVESHPLSDPASLARSGVTKVMWLDTPDRALEHSRNIAVDGTRSCISQPGYLELMNSSVSKSAGLKMAAEYLGIRREEIIALGDSDNDIDMLEWAGLGVAMANAADTVKSYAAAVTDSNDRDGVAAALLRFALCSR